MATELASGANKLRDGSAHSSSSEEQTPNQTRQDHKHQQQRRRLLPQPPAISCEPLTGGGVIGGGDGQSTPSGCVAVDKLSRRSQNRRLRPDYVSLMRRLSMDASQQVDRLSSTSQPTSSTQAFRSRLNRRTQMAFLEDIPKYAFGTSHTIIESVKTSEGNGCELESKQSVDSSNGDCIRESLQPPSASNSSSSEPLSCIFEHEFKELITAAVRLGCRHFDCAPLYKTQPLVGQCLSEIMKQIPRQQLFITSKLPPNMMRVEHIERSISKSIGELQCCYLDLFLIHAPFATRHLSDDQHYPLDEHGRLQMDEEQEVLENAWRKLVELKKRGFTRYIGLSNVNIEQLVSLHAIHPVDVVQNEYHIYNQNRDLFDFCEELDVHFEAYACFGNPIKSRSDSKPNCMTDPVLQKVARANGLTPAQAIIQWIHNQPLSYVIKCDNKRQLEENLLATKLAQLPVESLIELDSLDRSCRVHTFTEHKGLEDHCEYPFNDLVFELVNPSHGELRTELRWRRQLKQDRNKNKATSHELNLRPWQPVESVTDGCDTATSNNNNDDDDNKPERIETKLELIPSTAANIEQITDTSAHANNLNLDVSLGDFTTTPTSSSSAA